MKRLCRINAIIALILIFLPLNTGFGQDMRKIPFEMGDSYEDVVIKIKENGYGFSVDPDSPIFQMSKEERKDYFKRMMTRRMPSTPKKYAPYPAEKLEELLLKAEPLPDRFDWRDFNGKSFVGGVREQGGCGSCYSFGALAAAETAYNIKKGLTDNNCANFSESFLIWCLAEKYSTHFGGCDGSDYDYFELQSLVQDGIIFEKDFPYTQDKPESCNKYRDEPRVKFSSWHRCPCDDPSKRIELIKRAIANYGVVDAAVLVTPAFQAYKNGIFEDTENNCRTKEAGQPCFYAETNHAISLVGWGFEMVGDKKKEFFILRNSWGDSWGEKGYMRIDVRSAQVCCSAAYIVYDGN
jgi:C1A family cysteine protease